MRIRKILQSCADGHSFNSPVNLVRNNCYKHIFTYGDKVRLKNSLVRKKIKLIYALKQELSKKNFLLVSLLHKNVKVSDK